MSGHQYYHIQSSCHPVLNSKVLGGEMLICSLGV